MKLLGALPFLLVLAFGSTPLIGTQDLVILRDRSVEKGPLTACEDTRCLLGGTWVQRPLVSWVGFRTATAKPPAVKYPGSDEVHGRDGEVHAGHLVRIGPEVVVLQEGAFDRAQVTWVHLGAERSRR